MDTSRRRSMSSTTIDDKRLEGSKPLQLTRPASTTKRRRKTSGLLGSTDSASSLRRQPIKSCTTTEKAAESSTPAKNPMASMGLDRRKSSCWTRGRWKLADTANKHLTTLLWLGVLLLLCSPNPCLGQQDSDDWPPSDCPKKCKCTWIQGKKDVNCHNAGFTQIPTGLSPYSQVLDLSNNHISALNKDVFKSMRLENLQKLHMRSTRIDKIDRDAFRDLKIMIELDLSNNQITSLHADAFRTNDRLRELRLKDNPLKELQGQFPPLRYMRILDLSNCRLETLPHNIFERLAHLEILELSGNRFKSMNPDVIRPLAKLKSLSLKNNRWRCDCDLKLFRDWVISKTFYEQTTCEEPSHLAEFQWSKLQSSDFACKPDIVALQINGKATEAFIVAAEVGRNITLECLVRANPAPEVKWVRDGQVLVNSSRSHGKPYLLHIGGENERWVNLTIVKSDIEDAGEYTCVGSNTGGVVEKNLTLNFNDIPPIGIGGGPGIPGGSHSIYTAQSWIWLLIAALASLVIITMTIMIVCFCARRRRIKSARAQDLKNEAKFGVRSSEFQNGSVAGYTELVATQQSAHQICSEVPKQQITLSSHPPPANVLLDASKPHQPMSVVTLRRDGYAMVTQTEFELTDLPAMSQHLPPPHHQLFPPPPCQFGPPTTSFVPTSPDIYIPNYSTMGQELTNMRNTQQSTEGSTPLLPNLNATVDSTANSDYPDLLDISHPRSKESPAASIASTLPDSTRLILPQQLNPAALAILERNQHQHQHQQQQQYQYVQLLPHRPHSPYAASVCSFTSEPPVIVPPPHRPGYVTLPRRPRLHSWSPAFPSISANPTGTLPNVKVGPKYDDLGPRTTADGSSRLSLNKISDGSNPPSHQPQSAKTPVAAFSPAMRKILSPTSPTPPFVFAPIQELEPLTASNSDLADYMADGAGSYECSSPAPSDYTHSGTTPLIKKVPPRPPPKPKNKNVVIMSSNASSPLVTDDGTEV